MYTLSSLFGKNMGSRDLKIDGHMLDTSLETAVCDLDLLTIQSFMAHHPNYNINTKLHKSQFSFLMTAVAASPHNIDKKIETETRLSIIRLLIEKKADINYYNESAFGSSFPKRNALMLAAEKGYTKIIAELLKHKADVNFVNHHQQSALTLSIQQGNEENIALLLQNNANVNFENKSLRTPIFLATKHPHIMQMLLDKKANIDHVDKHKKTIFDYVEKDSKSEKLLKQYQRIQLIEKYKDNIVDIDGKLYVFIEPLKDRGQSAAAGFYKCIHDNETYIIKEDKASICVLESSADWVDQFIPHRHHRKVMNFTHCGLLTNLDNKTNQSDEKTARLVSIQPLLDAKPLDQIILKRKRRPKMPISDEWFNNDLIKNFIAKLSEKVKWDLALSLFQSTLAGDQSLHMGQYLLFMREDKITGLIKIDQGACGRDCYTRQLMKDFEHKTSKSYVKSGQFFNDYIGYFLQNNDVYMKYMYLWGRLTPEDVKKAIEASIQSFKTQLDKVPESQKVSTMNTIYDIFTKNLSIKRTSNVTQKELEDMIAQTVESRVNSMRLSAHEIIAGVLAKLEKKDSSESDDDRISSDFYGPMGYYCSRIGDNLKVQLSDLCKKSSREEKLEIIENSLTYLSYLRNRIYIDGIKKREIPYSLFPTHEKKAVIKNFIHLFQIKMNMLKAFIEYPYPSLPIKTAIQECMDDHDLKEIIEKLEKNIFTKDVRDLTRSLRQVKKESLINYLKAQLNSYEIHSEARHKTSL